MSNIEIMRTNETTTQVRRAATGQHAGRPGRSARRDRLRWTVWAFVGVAVLAAPRSSVAQSPEERGREVAEAADANDLGWQDNESNMRMVLRNRGGEESTRSLRRMALETNGAGLGDRSVIVFETPRDVEGTALLSHTRILEPDDQWLYLPALRRVKRISSGNKSGPFVGSEFAYEDLVSQEVDKYDYRWLRVESCGALECDVVERFPRYENSGYTRHVVWWDRAEHRVQRIDFYGRKDALFKTLTTARPGARGGRGRLRLGEGTVAGWMRSGREAGPS